MVLGWFAVVGVVGTITFVVVSNAGSGLGRASAAERVVVVTPEDSASTTVTPTGTATPSLTPPPSSATPAPTTTTTTKTSRPSDTPDPKPTSRAPRPTAPAVDPRTASFSTQGGIVVATCRGSKITLVSIRPRDGWRFDPESQRGALEVTFKTTEREVEIYLRCVDEVPTLLKPGTHWGAGDTTSSEKPSRPQIHPEESPSRQVVHPEERVQSEGQEHATTTPSPSPSTSPSTEETHHG
jgi:hypothetical protein